MNHITKLSSKRTIIAPDFSSQKRHRTIFTREQLRSLLFDPIHTGNVQLLKENLKIIPTLEILNQEGQTPFHVAIAKNNSVMLKILLEDDRANPNIPDQNGDYPIHCAVQAHSLEMVKLLANGGADVNVQNKRGDSSVNLAVEARCKDIFDFLLKKDCNLEIPDVDGFDPLITARMMGGKIRKRMAVEIKKRSSFNTLWLEQKLLAHRWSLNVNIPFNHRKVSLECFSSGITAQAAVQTMRAFAKTQEFIEAEFPEGLPAKQQLWREIADLLVGLHPLRMKIRRGVDVKGSIGAAIVMDDHCIGILCDQLLLKMDASSSKPGIEIYDVAAKDQVLLGFKVLFAAEDDPDGKQWLNKKIVDLLILTKESHIDVKQQDVGNCTWKFVKMMIRGRIYLHLRNKLKMPHKEAKEKSKPLYKLWSTFDRMWGLKKYLDKLDAYREEVEERSGFENPLIIDEQLMAMIVKKSYRTRYLPALEIIHQSHPFIKLDRERLRKVGLSKQRRLRKATA